MRSHEDPGSLCKKQSAGWLQSWEPPAPVLKIHIFQYFNNYLLLLCDLVPGLPTEQEAVPLQRCSPWYSIFTLTTKLNTICFVYRAMIVSGAVSRSMKLAVAGFANWIPQKVMWDKCSLSTEQTNTLEHFDPETSAWLAWLEKTLSLNSKRTSAVFNLPNST